MPFLSVLLHTTTIAITEHHQGWVGVYHTAHGMVADGRNSSAWDVGAWGVVAVESVPTDGGLSFEENIDFHCQKVGVNQLFGMLIAPTEGGVFNNPNDTDVLHPLPVLERNASGLIPGSAGPRGAAGLLQGAARWSALAKQCPQITGVGILLKNFAFITQNSQEVISSCMHHHCMQVVIDDFWVNYNWNNTPSPPPDAPCPHCPSDQSYRYGNGHSGEFCCTWPAIHGHCQPPSGQPPIAPCCLSPGTAKMCQGARRCGTNPRARGGW